MLTFVDHTKAAFSYFATDAEMKTNDGGPRIQARAAVAVVVLIRLTHGSFKVLVLGLVRKSPPKNRCSTNDAVDLCFLKIFGLYYCQNEAGPKTLSKCGKWEPLRGIQNKKKDSSGKDQWEPRMASIGREGHIA